MITKIKMTKDERAEMMLQLNQEYRDLLAVFVARPKGKGNLPKTAADKMAAAFSDGLTTAFMKLTEVED